VSCGRQALPSLPHHSCCVADSTAAPSCPKHLPPADTQYRLFSIMIMIMRMMVRMRLRNMMMIMIMIMIMIKIKMKIMTMIVIMLESLCSP